MSQRALLFFILICVKRMSCGAASMLPNVVQLGGAIVAAVEDDAEQEEQQRLQLANEQQQQLWRNLTLENGLETLERMLTDMEEGRGKFYKRRKMLKYLYPFLVGVLIAKTVLLPIILKILTAVSTSAFVMSKIALIVSGLLALKWIFAGSHSGVVHEGITERSHLDVMRMPALMKGYGNDWSDWPWSGSNFVEQKSKNQQHNYIPLGGGSPLATGMLNGFHYPQHNYETGKPFL